MSEATATPEPASGRDAPTLVGSPRRPAITEPERGDVIGRYVVLRAHL